MMNLSQLLKKHWGTKLLLRIMAIVALIGVADTVYLTASYYFGGEVRCLLTKGCEAVLTSRYSKIMNIPLAVFGAVFYMGMFILVNAADIYKDRYTPRALLAGGIIGFATSLVLLYIQLFVLGALCFYCLVSSASSVILFVLAVMLFKNNPALIEQDLYSR